MRFEKISKYNKFGQTVWELVFDDWDYSGHDEAIRGVACDDSNNIYVLSFADRINPEGEGSLYYSRIHKISSSGGVLWRKTFERNLTASWRSPIAVSSNGFCVTVVDQGEAYSGEGGTVGAKIAAFSSSGEALWSLEPLDYPQDIFIGNDGFIYVTDLEGLHKVNAQGEIIWTNTDVKANWAM